MAAARLPTGVTPMLTLHRSFFEKVIKTSFLWGQLLFAMFHIPTPRVRERARRAARATRGARRRGSAAEKDASAPPRAARLQRKKRKRHRCSSRDRAAFGFLLCLLCVRAHVKAQRALPHPARASHDGSGERCGGADRLAAAGTRVPVARRSRSKRRCLAASNMHAPLRAHTVCSVALSRVRPPQVRARVTAAAMHTRAQPGCALPQARGGGRALARAAHAHKARYTTRALFFGRRFVAPRRALPTPSPRAAAQHATRRAPARRE
jgi:hypothetical protein